MSHMQKISSRAASMIDPVLGMLAAGLLSASTFAGAPAAGAELTRSVQVSAKPAAVWAMIGGFCAIKDWHPAIDTCTEDGLSPPVRTLVTKDGKTTFVEMQVARDDARFSYSYNFVSSPFPVSRYIGTISVVPNGMGTSTIVWHGVYTPLPGKDAEASAAFAGVYEAGLGALKARFASPRS